MFTISEHLLIQVNGSSMTENVVNAIKGTTLELKCTYGIRESAIQWKWQKSGNDVYSNIRDHARLPLPNIDTDVEASYICTDLISQTSTSVKINVLSKYSIIMFWTTIYPTRLHVRPAKTQISLRIRAA